jgi:NAD(P)H-dependent FMN reductase
LIKAIAGLAAASLTIKLFDWIANLPQFSPDDDGDNVSKEVTHFRQLLCSADGVLICTPEYAHGVPGAIKNAIDWTISSSQFVHKPTMLITAATEGHYGHKALLETLKVIEAGNIEKLQMVIPFVKTKVSRDGQITDSKTRDEVNTLIARFIETINDK